MSNTARKERNKLPVDFDSLSLSVASPEQILSWSYGEVTKPETINYRTQKPERDGLFCERIFGPTKNWECYCGKYKKLRYKGIICDKCGVEVTRSSVRRERMGHIKLAVPVTHIWFLRSTPSRIGLLLNLPVKTLEQVVYFASYIIKSVDENVKLEAMKKLDQEYAQHIKSIKSEYEDKRHDKKKKELEALQEEMLAEMDEVEANYDKAKEDLDNIKALNVISELYYRELSMKFGHIFKAGIGGEAIREIIENLDLDKLLEQLRVQRDKSTGQKHKKLTKRIMLIGGLKKAGVRPEWMVMTVLPVIPPDLRPMVQLDGGRFAASDLNDLYRRIINRNNRLKRLLEIGAPEVICRNEKRMLQEAVDALLHNSARAGRAVTRTGSSRLQLKSLSDMLKGKQGRFRQNLLGKRVDFSGRSVIVVGPQLKLGECGIPKKMALELFKPFVIGKLIKKELAHNIKNAERLIEWNRPEVWDALDEVTSNYHVLLNRAPTLHRLGIQAFKPRLIEGKAIQLHPLVCSAFNADFDGDQMAVHVPLSAAAQKESREIMLSAKNLLKPASGEPITTPTQDMVLGCYYITHIKDDKKKAVHSFSNLHEAITSYRLGYVHIQDKVFAKINGEVIETSVGRMIFNSFVPDELGYKNYEMTKKTLEALFSECFDKEGIDTTAKLADDIKHVGFKFATKSGISIATSDLVVPESKKDIIKEATEKVNQIYKQYRKGLITDNERYTHTVNIWAKTKNIIADLLVKETPKEGSINYMISSGARGNWGQITQLAGIKGLVANPAGKTIELPIKSSFIEGFEVLEYFIATHGSRKGKSDTALKTAGAGYLTRRLVDAVQDVIIREEDCGSKKFVVLDAKTSEEMGETFANRIFGRIIAKPVADKKTGEVILKKGTIITRDIAAMVEEKGISEVSVRSAMSCNTEGGICQQCYGIDLAKNKLVEIGTPVGIIAAQSIGEPGTQLTMRTFHTGGVAEGKDITQGLPRVEELFEARNPKTKAFMADISGNVTIHKKAHQIHVIIESEDIKEETYKIPKGFEIKVKKRNKLAEKDIIASDKTSKKAVKAKAEGTVKDITEDTVVIKLANKEVIEYIIPGNESIKVKNGDKVNAGDLLTEGHLNLADLVNATSVLNAKQYVIKEVQTIYAAQGQTIDDKHIEIIVRQMFSKARIVDPAGSGLLPGQVVDYIGLKKTNKDLADKKKSLVKYERLLLGLTRVSLNTESWLSAASFQETIRVLVEAAVTKKRDPLNGLKENVIIGLDEEMIADNILEAASEKGKPEGKIRT